jgi:hypothetical protein
MDTAADLLEFVAPPLRTFGYELVERAPDRLVFRRRVTPAWTIPVAVFLFPFGLLAPLLAKDSETITIELVEQGRETLMVAQGTAPLRVRRAFALLEPSRSPTPGGTRR